MWHKLKAFFKAWENYLNERNTVPTNMSWQMAGEEPSANVSSKESIYIISTKQ